MELFTAATTVMAAIKAANTAYGVLVEAKKNITQTHESVSKAWTAAGKFIDAKATVDAYAEVDEENNDLSTDAFINSILFKRFEKEVDQIMLAFLKGEELKQWAAHKEAVREKALEDARHQIELERRRKRQAAIRRARFEENLNYAIWAVCICTVLLIAGAALAHKYEIFK